MTTTSYSNLNTAISQANTGAVGDKFLMKDGDYDLTSILSLNKSGIIFNAENYGKVRIIGGAIDLKGSSIDFGGFNLQYNNTRKMAKYIYGGQNIIHDNEINFVNHSAATSQNWINLRGAGNTVQKNNLHTKTGLGNFILVGEGDLLAPQNKIWDNKIHDFHVAPVAGQETNGYEVIRLGSSTTRTKEFFTDIAGNEIYDYKTPESELITVKSCKNTIRNNSVHDVSNSICLRHGRYNTVKDNNFNGTGLRIYGKGHTVTGNKFTRDPLNQLRQIVIGSGVYAEEEQNTTASYTQVRDLLFENNYIDMQDSTSNVILYWNYGGKSLKPINNKLQNNTIVASKGILANAPSANDWLNNTIANNVLWVIPGSVAKYGNMPVSGYVKRDPTTPTPTPTPIPAFADTFDTTYTLSDGQKSPDNKWICQYTGYGTAGVSGGSMNLIPKTSTSSGETHAGLVLSIPQFGNFKLSFDMRTNKQLRATPNNWETAWIMFRFVDDTHHYYFILKNHGCEFGKKDGGGQIFISTPSTPSVTLGQSQHIDVEATDSQFKISVGGVVVINTSNTSSFTNGHIGLYCEDSSVSFDNIVVY